MLLLAVKAPAAERARPARSTAPRVRLRMFDLPTCAATRRGRYVIKVFGGRLAPPYSHDRVIPNLIKDDAAVRSNHPGGLGPCGRSCPDMRRPGPLWEGTGSTYEKALLRRHFHGRVDRLALHRGDGGVDRRAGGEGAQGPVTGGREEPEAAGRRRHDLGRELTGRVEQPDVGAGQRLAALGHRSLDHGLLAHVDPLQAQLLGGCSAHGQTSFSTGTPTSEPYSVHEPL